MQRTTEVSEDSRAFCASLDDHSQVVLKDVQEWRREPAIDDVKFVTIAFAAI